MSRNVVCSQCGHSLSMSEDIYNRRVAGKVVTIKCRQCSTPIRVDGRQDAPEAVAAPPAPPPEKEPAAAAPPFNDPLDPFTLPESSAPSVPRAPMPSLDEVVSSAPRIPTGLKASDSPFAQFGAAAAEPSAPRAAPAAPAAPKSAPDRPAAPPAPPPRAAAPSAPEAAAPPPRAPERPAAAVAAPPAAPTPAAPAAPAAPSPPSAPLAAAAAAPAAAAPFSPPAAYSPPVMAEASAPRMAADLDPATLRDPHAAFRRKSPKAIVAAAAGVALIMGAVIYASSGGEPKAVKKPVEAAEKPVIGVSLAPYRSDAQETMPAPAQAPAARPAQDEAADAAPTQAEPSGDFAERFKAASGRE